MTTVHRELVERIRGELVDLGIVIQRATRSWERGRQRPDEQDVRPAVIGRESAVALDEFRRFRHLVRNVYAFNLVPQKLNPLMAALPGLWQRLYAELSAFASFLEEVGKSPLG